jgi:hypothetical protein
MFLTSIYIANTTNTIVWSKTTLNYQMMVERYPNLKEEVGGSDPGFEISSLADGKLARWSSTSYALALARRPFVSKKTKQYITVTTLLIQ